MRRALYEAEQMLKRFQAATWRPDPVVFDVIDRAEIAATLAAVYGAAERTPTIVVLCGSTGFYREYLRAYFEETLAGKIVLSIGFYPHASKGVHGHNISVTPGQKERLDQLYLRKIDLADEVLVLNVGGYIGESTAKEIAHAKATGKPLRFLEPSGERLSAAL